MHGIKAPEGKGVVLEVHLDIQQASAAFASWLQDLGFEPDPFTMFHPAGYTAHMTGRARVPKRSMQAFLQEIEGTLDAVMRRARRNNTPLYAEVEIATSTARFEVRRAGRFSDVLSGFRFERTGRQGGAKADIHLEFDAGTVPALLREYLKSKCFYWVATPSTEHFGAEEIATLQTSTFVAARRVYERLVTRTLPFATGIHLEQKLFMRASHEGLPMPEVINVSH
ncbi:MAG: hypothetical protein Q8Q32_01940 [bacterium]|nr:hypothetical protein [bacterium]